MKTWDIHSNTNYIWKCPNRQQSVVTHPYTQEHCVTLAFTHLGDFGLSRQHCAHVGFDGRKKHVHADQPQEERPRPGVWVHFTVTSLSDWRCRCAHCLPCGSVQITVQVIIAMVALVNWWLSWHVNCKGTVNLTVQCHCSARCNIRVKTHSRRRPQTTSNSGISPRGNLFKICKATTQWSTPWRVTAKACWFLVVCMSAAADTRIEWKWIGICPCVRLSHVTVHLCGRCVTTPILFYDSDTWCVSVCVGLAQPTTVQCRSGITARAIASSKQTLLSSPAPSTVRFVRTFLSVSSFQRDIFVSVFYATIAVLITSMWRMCFGCRVILLLILIVLCAF